MISVRATLNGYTPISHAATHGHPGLPAVQDPKANPGTNDSPPIQKAGGYLGPMLNTVSSHNDFSTRTGIVRDGVSTVPARGVAPSGRTENVPKVVDKATKCRPRAPSDKGSGR